MEVTSLPTSLKLFRPTSTMLPLMVCRPLVILLHALIRFPSLELYIWPFAEAVRAGSLAVMCSYNKLNGTLGCEDGHSLNTVLKGELGFKGFVLSVRSFPLCLFAHADLNSLLI